MVGLERKLISVKTGFVAKVDRALRQGWDGVESALVGPAVVSKVLKYWVNLLWKSLAEAFRDFYIHYAYLYRQLIFHFYKIISIEDAT